jgi:NAD(P)-dependent dehydrogenase (short-subunit alcohol dehydrogenase family)
LPALFRLDGRVAIVTGGAGLLGEQHAIALAESGAHVVLSDRRVDVCESRAATLSERYGVAALGFECDVVRKDSWGELLEAAMASFGRVDVLVNNAAFTNDSRSPGYAADVLDFPLQDWDSILAVNLTGTFLGCQVIGRQMLAAGSGSIINLSSLYGVVSPNHRIYPGTGVAQPVAYATSKAGVLGLTRYLATLWADRNVRVNAITPGGVFNEQDPLFRSRFSALNPMGRMARSDELRGAVVYLASDASSYCTGHNLIVDGGWTAW